MGLEVVTKYEHLEGGRKDADRSGPTHLNSSLRFSSGFSADFYAASLTVGSSTI